MQEQKPPRSSQGEASQIKPRNPYTKSEILHELELETRAGTPLVVDPLDPLGLEPKK